MLRRHTFKLIAELETNIRYTTLSAKSKKTIESREIVERRVAFLEDVLMERCYLAFGGLVADNQYAALGLMLVGTLARLTRVMRPLRAAGEEAVERDNGNSLESQVQYQDLGEIVSREGTAGEEGLDEPGMEDGEYTAALKTSRPKTSPATAEEARNSPVKVSAERKRPKKRRKREDAFDDLFAGLI